MMQFSKATKKQSRLRLALIGPSGSGKTYSALKIASFLGGKVAVIDTERGSASKYADLFEFDVLELDSFSPLTYVEAIKTAEAAGYAILVIDSLSHAWMGKEGALEQVDKAAKRSQSGNSFAAWRDVTPMHNALVDAMLQSRCHVIATLRAKTEYVIETNERGKQVPRKVGLAPVQRDGLEYEFDVVGDMNLDNELIIAKTRCPALHGLVLAKPGKEVAETLKNWLTDGSPVTPQNSTKPAPESIGQTGKPVHNAPVAHQEAPETTQITEVDKDAPEAPEMPLFEETPNLDATCTSDGIPYTELKTADLTPHLNALLKKQHNGEASSLEEQKIANMQAILKQRASIKK